MLGDFANGPEEIREPRQIPFDSPKGPALHEPHTLRSSDPKPRSLVWFGFERQSSESQNSQSGQWTRLDSQQRKKNKVQLINMKANQPSEGGISVSVFSKIVPSAPANRQPLLAGWNRLRRAIRMALSAALLSFALYPQASQAIIANPNPVELRQPNGASITLRIRGDEWFHWLEDLQGYTVILDQGAYVYATLDAQGLLAPTGLAVGATDPGAAGLTKGMLPSSPVRAQLRQQAQGAPSPPTDLPQRVPPRGTVKNLVILCKFSDHVLGTHTRDRADYDVLFNAVGGHPTLAPTGSVKDYYTETSYGTMTLNSTVIAWVTLPHTEAYYADGSSGEGPFPTNPQGMVRDALVLADPLVNFADFDTDNDGYVDAIDIIHSGYAAETGGAGSANWIWSHRWNLYQLPGGKWTSADVNGNGVNVKVYDYHTEAALWGTSGTQILRVGVIAHETGHFFGLPDLYDTDNSSEGIGSYCMMANSWGFDGTQLRPPHFSAWCKSQLGWVTPTVISPGNFTALQVETSPTVFRINAGYPSGEYLLIENRQKVGFENNLPQGGLAIWHIDEAKANNKQEGFPGQAGWPGNNNHFKIALLQADGLYQLERNANRGDGGDVYRGGGVSVIGADTVPNTHAYQNGAILVTSNRISAISASGASMTFTYSRLAAGAAPTISGFNPTSGPVGTSVVISGANFIGATAVRFNGVSAGTYTVNNAAQITATAPGGATTGPISVTSANGTATSAASFTVTAGGPANDNFGSAQSMSGLTGSASGGNAGATKEAAEPNHAANAGGKSIWFAWTAPGSGSVTVDTLGSNFDTLLAVYTGNSVGALTAVASNDDTTTNNQSRVSFTAVAGTVYRIAVDGFNGASGNVVLNWASSSSMPSISGFAPPSGLVGTVVLISGANFTGATAVRFNGVSAPGYTVNNALQITATVPAGATTGPISVTTPGGTATSAGNFTVTSGTSDNFANGQVISGATGSVNGNTTAATKEAGEPNHAGNAGGKSIWYFWTAPASGPATIDTLGSSYDTLLGVYTGNAVGALAAVVSNNDTPTNQQSAASFTAVAGTVYRIAVDGFNGASGNVVLNWRLNLGNDNFANGQGISGTAGSANGVTTGATKEAREPNHGGNTGGKSIWYFWTSPSSGTVTLDTVGSGFDTLLGVYTGNAVGALSLIVGNDDIFGGSTVESQVSFTAVAGTVYRIAVDGYGGASGNVVLNWALNPVSPSITGFAPGSGPVGASVVISGTNISGAIAVRFNGLNATFTVNTALQITTTVPAGATTGPISVTTPGGVATSAGTFTVTSGFNDNFAAGQVISGNTGSVNGSTVAATKEAGEPDHADNTGGKSIWYSWTAPGTGSATIDTVGSSFDTLLGVYTGGSVGALTLIVSNDDIVLSVNQQSRVTFPAVAGTVYRIAVDGYNDTSPASGSVVLHWQITLGNDNFAAGQVISGSAGSVPGSSTGATKEAGEPAHAGNAGGRSIWYYWTAPSSGGVAIDTAGSSFDTLLGVYTGSSVGALTLIASNDDFGGLTSSVSFAAVAGTVYRIAVDGFNGTAGSVVLNWQLVFGNDNFAGGQVISGNVGSVAGNNTLATKEPGEPDHAGNNGGKSLWYYWTAPGSGPVTFDTIGASFDTLLGVYTGGSVSALTLIAGNDDIATNNFQSRVSFPAVAGTVYRIAVDGYNDTSPESGSVALNWLLVISDGNNSFANAQVISGPAGTVTGNNSAATKEAGEPNHAGNAGGKSIWYAWTAPSGNPVTLDTLGSGFDTLLAVYMGGSVGALTPIASNDDLATNNLQSGVSFMPVAGTVYRIAVDGYDGAAGSVTLNWGPAAPSAAPLLGFGRNGNQIVLAWPASSVGFVLESTPALTSGAPWSVVSPAPVIVNGNFTVTNTISGGSKYYRLRTQ